MNFKTYKGDIIQFMGGLNNYVGEVEQFEDNKGKHPNGEGWIRLNKPCIQQTFREGKKTVESIGLLGGPARVYRQFVDIYVPPGQSITEIRVLDPAGSMIKVYRQQINQVKLERIILPQ